MRPRLGALLELSRYLCASVVALAVDTGLYALALGLHVAYPFAACIGFLAGLAVAYTISIRWAFDARRVRNPRIEFLIFAAVGIVGLLLTESLLWLQVDVLALAALPAKIGASGGVFLFNFIARKTLLFKSEPAAT
jgi:putative flippase GtrA